MKRYFSIFLVLILLLGLCACGKETEKQSDQNTPEQEGESLSMNIMSFNLLYKNRTDVEVAETEEKADMRIEVRGPGLNQILTETNIDICGVQEAAAPWEAWFSENLPAEYDFLGQKTVDTGEGGFILYRADRYEVVAWDWFGLHDGDDPHDQFIAWDGDHDRLCTWALFREKSSGMYFLFFDTHLDNGGKQARQGGAELILYKIDELRTKCEEEFEISCPVFLVGDMNCETYDDAYETLASELQDIRHASKGATVEDEVDSSPDLYYLEDMSEIRRTGHYIDHMFSTDDVTVTDMFMIHTATNLCEFGPWLSDHNAVWASVTITNG